MYQESGEILEHDRLSDDILRIRIGSEKIRERAAPGQFVMLKVADGIDPLLRRPFSLHDVHDESFELLYRVVGKGTSVLSGRRCGDSIDSIGPLGEGFKPADGRTLLVAGGMGIAPLLFLSRRLKEYGKDPVLAYGAGTASSLVRVDSFRSLGVTVKLATEDGSMGFAGTCVDLLELELSKSDYGAVYACGPARMLAVMSGLCERYGVESCQVSIEARMACGVGACMGCSVSSKSGGYRAVCKDGPVFEIGEIAF
jgi:dihydroorotate dehydrogenase electron transfer subunit